MEFAADATKSRQIAHVNEILFKHRKGAKAAKFFTGIDRIYMMINISFKLLNPFHLVHPC